MVPRQRVLSYMRARPFRPLRITTASGRTLDVRHPENIELTRSTFTIVTGQSNESEHEIEVSVLLTESIEPLEAAARTQGA